jgi:V8-like Glu-specific endopeptidase
MAKAPNQKTVQEPHRARNSESREMHKEPAVKETATSPQLLASKSNTLEIVPGYRKPTVTAAPTSLPADAIAGSLAERSVAEVVIDVDDRVRVTNVEDYPWRAICALRILAQNGRRYVGTGWLIGPRTVATAGHCVFMHDAGGWAKEIAVIPALDGEREPRGKFASKTFRAVDGWIRNQSTDSDYGVIQLDQPIGDEIGYFAFGAVSDSDVQSVDANISGYPADRDGASHQYYHARRILKANRTRLFYDIDTVGGQSGSPIWIDLGSRGRVAIGVHTTGAARGTSGTRINDDVLANLRAWKKE